MVVDRDGAGWFVLRGPRAAQVFTADPQVKVFTTKGA
jgi:hypothetical protein